MPYWGAAESIVLGKVLRDRKSIGCFYWCWHTFGNPARPVFLYLAHQARPYLVCAYFNWHNQTFEECSRFSIFFMFKECFPFYCYNFSYTFLDYFFRADQSYQIWCRNFSIFPYRAKYPDFAYSSCSMNVISRKQIRLLYPEKLFSISSRPALVSMLTSPSIWQVKWVSNANKLNV